MATQYKHLVNTPPDIFYNPEGIPAETHHVFITPSAHHLTHTCRLGETGFGTGLNLIAAAGYFLEHAPAEATLTFLSTENSPLSQEALASYHDTWPEALKPLAAQLRAVYPHCFDTLQWLNPRIAVQVLCGDAAETLSRYTGAPMDAWFFDGFAPAVNPDMWSASVFSAAARLSLPHHTTYGTFTAAGWVRRNLSAAGFSVSRTKGFMRKRHCLRGLYAPS